MNYYVLPSSKKNFTCWSQPVNLKLAWGEGSVLSGGETVSRAWVSYIVQHSNKGVCAGIHVSAQCIYPIFDKQLMSLALPFDLSHDINIALKQIKKLQGVKKIKVFYFLGYRSLKISNSL